MRTQKHELTVEETSAMLVPAGRCRRGEVYRANPFLAASKGNAIIVRGRGKAIGGGFNVSDSNGQSVTMGALYQYEEVDDEQFIKVYTKNCHHFFGVSKAAQTVLVPVYVAYQDCKDKDYIDLPYSKAAEIYRERHLRAPARSTFNRGIQDLIAKNFIALHPFGECYYWINPFFIFNGNRIRYIREYKLGKSEDVDSSLPDAGLSVEALIANVA